MRIKKITGLFFAVLSCVAVIFASFFFSPTALAQNSFSSAAQEFMLSGDSEANNVKLFWQAVPSASQYRITRISSDSARSIVATVEGNQLDDYGLSLKETYYYQIDALDAENQVVASSRTNSVSPFTPSHITFTQDNVGSSSGTKVMDSEDLTYESKETSTTNVPLSGTWQDVSGDSCPAEDVLSQYWGIRSPREKWDSRSSTFWWNKQFANGQGILQIVQRTWWDFIAEVNGNPVHFQCATKKMVNDASTGQPWQMLNSRIECDGEVKNSKTGHAVFYGHLEGNSGYTRAAYILVDVDPDKGIVHTYADRPMGEDTRDSSLFVDDDDNAYIVAATNNNKDIDIISLNADWNSPVKLVAKPIQGGRREAPTLTKIDNVYYLVSSGVEGHHPTQAMYAYSNDLSQGWSDLHNFGEASNYDAQAARIRIDKGSKRTTYSELAYHWGGHRNPTDSLGDVARAFPIAKNGDYMSFGWYPTVVFDDEYGAVPVQTGKNLARGKQATDSEHGKTNIYTDGNDSVDSAFIEHKNKPYSITLDLGSNSSISEVDFSTRQQGDADTLYQYSIEISQDNKNYQDILNISDNKRIGFIPNRFDSSRKGRYIRLTIHDWPVVQDKAQSSIPVEGMFEVSVFGKSDTVAPPQDPYKELDALAKAHASDLADGTYVVSSALKDGLVLDVSGGSAKNGANVQVWSSNGTKAQRWAVSHDSRGYVTLRNANSGRMLDVSGGSAKAGANVQQYASNSYRSQKWVAVRDGSSYRLVSALSGSLVLDVSGGSAKNGANVQVWSSNGYAAQKWTFKVK